MLIYGVERLGPSFEHHGVFFSWPLDLGMEMLRAFPDAYKKLPKGAKGPQKPDDADREKVAAERVLGSDGFGNDPCSGVARRNLPNAPPVFAEMAHQSNLGTTVGSVVQ